MRRLFIALSLFLFFPAPVLAQSEFSTRFSSVYDVSSEGITTVTHQIELTNLLAQIYASQYALTIGSTQIKNISVTSPNTTVEASINTAENSTQITATFADPVVGKGQTLRFTVSYLNLDIAQKTGRVLEVNIPKISNSATMDDYSAIVRVPDSFDAPTVMSPVTDSVTHVSGQQILRYTKSQILDKSISILFGDHQLFDFSLRYSLTNPGLTATSTKITLPPDTAFQKMVYTSITPTPDNVTVDPDGNWLATYTLASKENLEIRANGQVTLYLKPQSYPDLAIDTAPYLTSQKYWPITDSSIAKLAGQLRTPQAIYDYLVDNFSYDYGRIDSLSTKRLGAATAIANPQNTICTEFTDAFVAIARAAGIPARAVDGYAYTNNPKLRPLSLKLDVLHAWPEYYDQQRQLWIPIDPTWGNTTGGVDYFSRWDLNHFAFAIHGQDSLSPLPAGAYKLDQTLGKDVSVAFTDTPVSPHTNLKVDFFAPHKLVITNTGNNALPDAKLQLSAPGYTVTGYPTSLPTLPPYGQHTLKLKLKRTSAVPGPLTVKINSVDYTYDLPAAASSYSPFLPPIAAAVVASAGLFSAFLARRLPFFHRKK